MMKNLNTITICLFIGLLLGMFVQGMYDVKHLQTPPNLEIIRTDTIFTSDTITNEVQVAKYHPMPVRETYKIDTMYLHDSITPIYSVKTHKVYIDTIDTTKTLQDTLKYHQRISYYIATTDKDIDTINISAKEDVPIITRLIEKEKYVYKKPKWNLTAGIGAGITPKGEIQPNIGITLGYSLWQLK